MSRDITRIIEGWDYDPDEICVRIVRGEDGREKIQMRLDLGLLQMEIDGRPDGLRPEGCDSWLDYYRAKQRLREASHPDEAPLVLNDEDCERLLREGIQYYHRYLSFWHLQRYELCARDTSRNLKLFQFVREHARHERDRRRFDQWRPYVTMMHTRAVATPLVELGDAEAAIKAIDAGIQGIWRFLEEYDQTERAAQCIELTQLKRWRDELASKLDPETPELPPTDPLTELREQLATAVAEERFEDAVRLRDEIQRLSLQGPPEGEKL